jgi:hypothetical protein
MNILIPASTPFNPESNNQEVSCKSMVLTPGAVLNLKGKIVITH